MEETAVAEAQAAPQQESAGAVTVPDPFQLEETSFASLSPEQRASLDPILDTWKKKAQEEIQKRESTVTEKYRPVEEKAQALEKLTKYAPFVQWWQTQQNAAAQNATPGQQTAISQTKPNDVATPQEWQEALWETSQGDSTKLQAIQSRMMAAWATPFVQNITQRQKALEVRSEIQDLFERHVDAKDLDLIGIDPKTKEGTSILEIGLDWAERNGKSIEDGYAMAKRWADSIQVQAQQKAMGLVTDKKQGVTAGNSTSTNNNPSIIEVDSADELLKRSLEAEMSGQKNVRFVIRTPSRK